MKARLELRPLVYIGLAYAIAPFAVISLTLIGLNIIWSFTGIGNNIVCSPNFNWQSTIIIGEFLFLLIEIVFISPIIFGYHRYQWVWLNTYSGILIGFFLGALPCISIFYWSHLKSQVGLFPITPAGAAQLEYGALASAVAGCLGALTAISFRLIAVRTVRDTAELKSRRTIYWQATLAASVALLILCTFIPPVPTVNKPTGYPAMPEITVEGGGDTSNRQDCLLVKNSIDHAFPNAVRNGVPIRDEFSFHTQCMWQGASLQVYPYFRFDGKFGIMNPERISFRKPHYSIIPLHAIVYVSVGSGIASDSGHCSFFTLPWGWRLTGCSIARYEM